MRVLIPYAATHGLRPFQAFFPDLLWRVNARARTAYLTFDDGPTVEMTRPILELLAEYDAKATHFLLGRHADQHPSLVKAISKGGHQIGNHSYNHRDPWTLSQDELNESLLRTTSVLETITGRPIRALRPPYGHPTSFLRQWCAERNQRMVMWDVMPGDFLETATTHRVANFVINHIRPGSVVVLHDNPVCQDVTIEALQLILQRLSEEGWTFDALQ